MTVGLSKSWMFRFFLRNFRLLSPHYYTVIRSLSSAFQRSQNVWPWTTCRHNSKCFVLALEPSFSRHCYVRLRVSVRRCFPIFTQRWCHSINCPFVCPSVTFRYRDPICWNTSKIISPPNSDKIVMWRFLRNRRLLMCLHTIFGALIYWAHRAVILAIAWYLVFV